MPRPLALCHFSWSHDRLRERLNAMEMEVIEFRRRLLAYGIATTPSRAQRWIDGKSTPGVEIAAAMARVLECRIESFLNEGPLEKVA